ncbi:hypothetical protein Hypma_001811 [Hypsizygus marmoreus]|uniref:F-box domain-containing protein n=1 Tax=Hypsizygus marmoreus TaxID=39966 RepID=A0A369J9Q6_HYPMA|nr:hypothetical protein Hypma_001811 [Hypsizygus marmoreus]
MENLVLASAVTPGRYCFVLSQEDNNGIKTMPHNRCQSTSPKFSWFRAMELLTARGPFKAEHYHGDVKVSRSSTRIRTFARRLLKGLFQRSERSSVRLSPMSPEQHRSDIFSSFRTKLAPPPPKRKELSKHSQIGRECDSVKSAHINLLPCELLVEIFLYVLPEKHHTIIRPCTRYPHMTLSQVCHHWQDVLVSTTALWKSFSVEEEEDEEEENKRLKRIIDRTLGRSRARGASLKGLTQFWFNCLSPAEYAHVAIESTSRSVVPVLTKNLGRCGDLMLRIDKSSAKDILSVFSGDTSSLRSVAVSYYRGEKDEAKVIYEEIMNNQALLDSSRWQHLTRLLWFCSLMPFALLNVSMPQLMYLTIESIVTLDEILVFMSRCPHLRVAELSDLRIGQNLPVNMQLVLPWLHTLNISCRKGEDPLDALDHFTLPTLSFLTLSSTLPTASPRNYRAISGLCARSACRIDKLYIHDYLPSTDAFAGYLTHPFLQTIEALRIVAYPIRDRTLKLLKYSSGNGRCLLPNLRDLDLHLCSTTDGLVADVVASRWRQDDDEGNALARLQEVSVVFDEQHNEKLHERDEMVLKSLSEEGLPITLRSRACPTYRPSIN